MWGFGGTNAVQRERMAAKSLNQLPWKFAERIPAAVQTDPFEDEFFIGSSDSELDDGHVASLVRESVQNALDARVGSGPVRVSFALHEARFGDTRALDYLAGLKPHLAAITPPVPWPAPHGDARIRWLVYEDFNTRGLGGDPEIYADDQIPPGGREDFYWFWRNIGRSAKSGENLGRWGLGKTVFPSSSEINCIIGLTHRADDGRLLLMGQSVLRNHSIKGTRFLPHGLLCDPSHPGSLPMPLEGAVAAHGVAKTFRLARDGETGLSIVVPFLREGIHAVPIARALCSHFFVRILQEQLIAEITDENGVALRIDEATIDSVIASVPWEKSGDGKRVTSPPIDLTRQALASVKSGAIGVTLAPSGAQGTANWSRDLIPKEVSPVLAEKLATPGELVAIRVPLVLARAGGEKVPTSFDVFLRRRGDGKGEAWHVRDGMTISAVSRTKPAGGDVEGLLLVTDQTLSSFLGDAEGPAHVEWHKDERRLARNWQTYDRRIGFVSNAIAKLAEFLKDARPRTTALALAKVFSVRVPKGPSDDSESRPPGPRMPPQPKVEWFTINDRARGFTIRTTPTIARPSGASLLLEIAYDASIGNPFDQWSEFDFTLADPSSGALRIQKKNVEMTLVAGNTVQLKIQSDPFYFSVVGFDPYRDVIVRVDPVTSNSPGSEGDRPVA
jgi:hypothetical protein